MKLKLIGEHQEHMNKSQDLLTTTKHQVVSHACSENRVTSLLLSRPPTLAMGASTYSITPARRPVRRTMQKAMKYKSSKPAPYFPVLGL